VQKSNKLAANIPTWLVKVPTDSAAVLNTELPHELQLPQPHPDYKNISNDYKYDQLISDTKQRASHSWAAYQVTSEDQLVVR